ncbi:hypothetical protein [uncultured Lactobacillus sp.]|uniref:hypothetical protein n=1 Tax=uncultured Lactobacillus sp. TaxID=153152 RepID=UPI0026659E1F|nr:hypothetical protein [uncultured Lactobacillus sp.]
MEEHEELLRVLTGLRRSLSKEDYEALAQAVYFVTGKQIMGSYGDGGDSEMDLRDAKAALLRSQTDNSELGYIKQTINDLYKLRALYASSRKDKEGKDA